MKTLMTAALAATVTLALFAEGIVKAEKKPYQGWVARECAIKDQLAVRNDVNFYGLNFVQYLPNQQGKTDLQIHLSEPRQQSGYGRMTNCFFNMEVNGIKHYLLQPQKDFLTVWNKAETAGGTAILNFDGAKVEVDAYMREKSPILWFTIRQPEKQVEPIKTIKLNITMIISDLKKNEKGGVIWGGAYHRQAQTATRKLEQQKGKIELTAEDQYLILSDAELDGTSKEKGYGPVYFTYAMDGVQKASLNLENGWINSVMFELKPDFKEFKFGIHQTSGRLTNEEFPKQFESNKADYLLK